VTPALPAVAPALPAILDLLGVAIFALTGALLAARLKQTFVTMSFFALITGVGGGSVRDLLIGAQVFWVRDPWVTPVCLATALIVWLSPHRWWTREEASFTLLEWADAAGLAAYSVLGTAKALNYGVAPVPAILMGIITGCVGGIIRDVLAARPSILMRPELYVTVAALASALCAGGSLLGLPNAIVWPIAALAGFALRGTAIQFGLALPAYGRTDTRRD
jgi:uncharacterized membrane protein YeiH